MPNTPRKSKEWLFFPYLAGLKNSYPEILYQLNKSWEEQEIIEHTPEQR
jgi:hypothetical protein